jgi:hypothetical protein
MLFPLCNKIYLLLVKSHLSGDNTNICTYVHTYIHTFIHSNVYMYIQGAHGSLVVKALGYKPEGRGSETR